MDMQCVIYYFSEENRKDDIASVHAMETYIMHSYIFLPLREPL